MNRMKKSYISLILAVILLLTGLLAGCGKKPAAEAEAPATVSFSVEVPEEEPDAPEVEAEDEDDQDPEDAEEPEVADEPEIAEEPGTVEEPAAEPAVSEPKQEEAESVPYYFRNKKLLNSHYEKHGIEMGFDSPKEYEAAASDVINNPDALHKIEKEDGDGVYYVEATNEFVILSKDGYIRTYFLPSAGIKYYNRQ